MADNAACLDAIAGYDGIDDRALGAGAHGSHGFAAALRSCPDAGNALPLAGVKIGLLKEGFGHSALQPEVRDAVLSAARKFESLGASVREVSVPQHLEGPAVWTIQQRISGTLTILGQAAGRRGLYLTEFERARLPWTTDNFRRLFPSTQNTVINGLYLMEQFPGLYGKAMNVGRRIGDAFDAALGEVDFMVMPTTPFVAPRHGTRGGTPRECFEPTIGLTVNTAVFNVTGHPALTLPVGFAPARDDGSVALPVGMQMVGPKWGEKELYRAAHAWETAFDWRRCRYMPREGRQDDGLKVRYTVEVGPVVAA